MKNTTKLGIILTGIYELIIFVSMALYNTCALPFSTAYYNLNQQFLSVSNTMYLTKKFCYHYASPLQMFLLCIVIPAFFWFAIVSIRSIKHFLSFWLVYELVVILSIFNINSCLIPFGTFPMCYKTPTIKQYVLLCVVVPLIYLLIMLWKKEIDKLNSINISKYFIKTSGKKTANKTKPHKKNTWGEVPSDL